MKSSLLTFIFVLLSFSFSQQTIDTFFTTGELAALEKLVGLAGGSSPSVLLAIQNVSNAEAELAIGKQLLNALTFTGNATLAGDFYGQVSPSYSVSVGLDVIALLEQNDRVAAMTIGLESARAKNRVDVVRAFTTWKVATERAKAAGDYLQSVSLTNELVVHKLNVGDATQSDVTRAISDLSGARMALLEANANVIVSLEGLASVVGTAPRQTLDTIHEILQAHGEPIPTNSIALAGN